MKVFAFMVLFLCVLMFLSYTESKETNHPKRSLTIEQAEDQDSVSINFSQQIAGRNIDCMEANKK